MFVDILYQFFLGVNRVKIENAGNIAQICCLLNFYILFFSITTAQKVLFMSSYSNSELPSYF